MLVRMRHEDVHFEKKKLLTNSGRKKSAPSQRDPPAKIVFAKFLYQNDSKRLYVVSLHCWRCGIAFSGQFLCFAFQSFRHRSAVFLDKVLHKKRSLSACFGARLGPLDK